MDQDIPSKDRVVAELRRRISSSEWSPNTKIPVASDLCRFFGVSRNTLFAALAELENEGIIYRRRGSGAFVSDPNEKNVSEKELPPPEPRSEQVAQAIANDIAAGHLKTGDILPLKKELRFRYKTSKRILSAALRFLEERKLVHASGTVLRIGQPAFRSRIWGKAVRIYGDRKTLTQDSLATPQSAFFRSFEKELQKQGSRLDRVLRWEQSLSVMRAQMASHEEFGTAYMLLSSLSRQIYKTYGPENQSHIRPFPRVGHPTVLFSNESDYHKPGWRKVKAPENLYVIANNEEAAGRDVAGYLAAAGHTNIGYFSYSDEPWNRDRLAGLRKGFQAICGEAAAVYDYSQATAAGAILDFDATGGDTPAGRRFKRASENTDKIVANLFKGYRFKNLQPHWRIFLWLYSLVIDDDKNEKMKPVFARALGNPEITAWVCSDSIMGLIAHDVLDAGKVPVPDRISLIALDDNDLLRVRGITGHDFQYDQMGYLAAHCILGDIPIKRKRNGVVECPGRIVERGTVVRVGSGVQ